MLDQAADGLKGKLQVIVSATQIGTVVFLIVGYFVTVSLEQKRVDMIEKVVDNMVSKGEVNEMLKTSNEIHQNLREQIALLRQDDIYIRQDLADMQKQINAIAARRQP